MAKQNDPYVLKNIKELAALGCSVDLDNFGTGQSSITNLRNFPVQRIKIDKSFVSGMHLEKGQKNIMRAIMPLADQLGIQALAEGVEQLEELKMLSDMGCEFVQGFCIARPMPLDDALTWLTSYNQKLSNSKSALKVAV